MGPIPSSREGIQIDLLHTIPISRRKRPLWIIFTFFVALLPLSTLLAWAAPATDRATLTAHPKWEAALQEVVETAQPDELIRFILFLPEQPQLEQLSLSTEKVARRQQIVDHLQSFASTRQDGLLTEIAFLRETKQIQQSQPLWIINAIAVKGTVAALSSLSAHPDVDSVKLDQAMPLPTVPFLETTTGEPLSVTWNLEAAGAPQVWEGLGITGTDVVIGILDSGVQWDHPALIDNYRGNQDGIINHAGNFFDASLLTRTEPIDMIGHGTHVAGIAVGRNGIGMAPGAQWIAAKIADEDGALFDSYIHLGFQWMLAPNDNPALAPDIVNGSFGSPVSEYTAYLADVNTLRMAGIIQVFAAGNNGPFTNTMSAPASYTDTIAVGATAPDGTVAWFSSRAPSPLTEQIKPTFVAPGVNILSASQHGGYVYRGGTSMSSPMAAGGIALMLAADPSLSEAEVVSVITSTVSVIESAPNQNSGWGSLDIYAAVTHVISNAGFIDLQLTGGGIPIPNGVVTVTNDSGIPFPLTLNGIGRRTIPLAAGTYMLGSAPFGFEAGQLSPIVVSAQLTTVATLDLTPLPAGTISGTVRHAQFNLPLPNIVVELLGTPLTTTTDIDGRYEFQAPAGSYQIRIANVNYQYAEQNGIVVAGASAELDFSLTPGSRTLFVDSGYWLYRDTFSYHQQAIWDAGYGFDTWSVTNPFWGEPTREDLAQYDTVIWSAPVAAPGVFSEDYTNVIFDYLEGGGNLFISGHEIGLNNQEAFPIVGWWHSQLRIRFTGVSDPPFSMRGVDDSPYAGITLTLNSGDAMGTANRAEEAVGALGSAADPIFAYNDGKYGGFHTGLCEPYEIVFLGAGLENIDGADVRAAVLERSYELFVAPPSADGARVARDPISDFVLPGQNLSFTLPILNLNETTTETFQITVDGAIWPTTIVTDTLSIGSCTTLNTRLEIEAPATLVAGDRQQLELTISSIDVPSKTTTYTVELFMPEGTLLLVDDDRFFNVEETFKEALDGTGINYDVWDIGWDNDVRGSPSTDFLSFYDFVVWYTGYDFFQPLSTSELESVTDYVEQGGRLFLTSQDFLYYHQHSSLAKNYFGIADYYESITPTQLLAGRAETPIGSLGGPYSLTYGAYLNNGDGILPHDPATVGLWSERGLPAGLFNSTPNWRTIFWGVPFETLAPTVQQDAMRHIIGWLGDLGDSTWQVNERSAVTSSDQPFVYTLTIRTTPSLAGNNVTITNSLPVSLTIDPLSLTGGAIYDAINHRVIWQGHIPGNQTHSIRYEAYPTSPMPLGTQFDNPIELHYQRHDLTHQLVATTWHSGQQLDAYFSTTAAPAELSIGTHQTVTLRLTNHGSSAIPAISTTMILPVELRPHSNTLSVSNGSVLADDQTLRWLSSLNANSTETLSILVSSTLQLQDQTVPITAYIDDQQTSLLFRDFWVTLEAFKQWLPAIFAGGG